LSNSRRVALVTGNGPMASSTAHDIEESLTGQGFAVTCLDQARDLVSRLVEIGPDVVLNAGSQAGDGRLQGVCELLRLRYTHSSVAASALAADRHLSKMLFKSAGLPVTDHVLVGRAEAAASHVLAPPYIAKSRHIRTGSAPIVIRHVENPPPEAILAEGWATSEEVMVERFLPGMTLRAFIMGDVLLGISATTDATKDRVAETVIPAPVSPKIYEDCTRLALRAHSVLGCRGVTALALRFNDRQGFGEPVVLGLDVQPDLSRTAPLAQIAARAGHSYDEFLRWIVEDASCDRVG
jgi:D-alanine-D-alanine ligase